MHRDTVRQITLRLMPLFGLMYLIAYIDRQNVSYAKLQMASALGLSEAAYGLGASKLQVSTRVVVPAALSGIVASFVLAISRAVGETMIVLIAAGARPNLTFNPYEAVQTMTAYIGSVGIGDVPTGSLEYKTIFAVGATLFLATFAMNLLAIRLVRRYREVYE